METLSIPLSKRKLWLLLLASCLFFAFGIWLWGQAPSYDDLDRIKATFASVACVIFFGPCIPVFAFKVFDRRAGVVINDKGIYRMGVFNYHDVIPWMHITHCTLGKIQRTKLLLIHVDNVEAILARLSPFTRWLQRMGIASSGTPYSLSSAGLEWNFEDLKQLIEAGILAHRNAVR